MTRLAALPRWPASTSSHPAGCRRERAQPGDPRTRHPPGHPAPSDLRPPGAAPPGPAGARRGRQAGRPRLGRRKGGRGPTLTAGSAEEETQRRPRQRDQTPAPASSSQLPSPKHRSQRRCLGLYGQSSGLAPTSATAAAPSGSACHETLDALVGVGGAPPPPCVTFRSRQALARPLVG